MLCRLVDLLCGGPETADDCIVAVHGSVPYVPAGELALLWQQVEQQAARIEELEQRVVVLTEAQLRSR